MIQVRKISSLLFLNLCLFHSISTLASDAVPAFAEDSIATFASDSVFVPSEDSALAVGGGDSVSAFREDSSRAVTNESVSAFARDSVSALRSDYDRLTNEQKRIVQNGGQVIIPQEVEGEYWPRMQVYQRVEATPEEAMAVMADYRRQQEYVHRVAKSVPVSVSRDGRTTVVDFILDLPLIARPFFDPNYRAQCTISYAQRNGTYGVRWKLLEAVSIASLEGGATIEPLPGGAAMIHYFNVIIPKTTWLLRPSLLKSDEVMRRAKRGGPEALQTFVDRINDEARNNRGLLDQQVQHLRSIFN